MELNTCPSCGGEIQPLKNGRWFCESCDAIFKITREGAKVESLAPLEELRRRVDAIEGKAQSGSSPGPESPAGLLGPEGPDTEESSIEDDDDNSVEALWEP